ncbi:MAG: phage gp6-like head-tail connector protein [Mesorhizobium sp.]|nr:MAG: phage gp6-like head-tail connector protein [Mesorhizobium sp.]
MAIVSLAEQKAHMRVDHSDDDSLISGEIDQAQAHIEQLLGFEIAVEFETPPADLIGVVMQLAAHFYEHREATVAEIAVAELPLGMWDVVRERRNYSF